MKATIAILHIFTVIRAQQVEAARHNNSNERLACHTGLQLARKDKQYDHDGNYRHGANR